MKTFALSMVALLFIIFIPSSFCSAQSDEVMSYSRYIFNELPFKADSILIARDELLKRFPTRSSRDSDDALRFFMIYIKNSIQRLSKRFDTN